MNLSKTASNMSRYRKHEKSGAASGGGISLASLLAVLFSTLKLCGVIHWSWLWVLAPIWMPITLMLLIIGAMFVWMMCKE